MKEQFKKLPRVDDQIEILKNNDKFKFMTYDILKNCIRDAIDYLREKIKSSDFNEADFDKNILNFNTIVLNQFNKKTESTLKKVINGTGTIIHTNLGRSVFDSETVEEVKHIFTGYNNLEYDLTKGKRGSRYDLVNDRLCEITGAEAALVVNNNAAAVMLVLSTLCKDKETIVSRGELVEIGGAFRIPDVMSASGSTLVEVGTTNKTHPRDYEEAINENTEAIMKVHTSNYRILGFTESVSVEDFVKIAKKKNILAIEDIGSGVFVDFTKYGLPYEPTVQASIDAGMDVVTFSGDKLLGGPQAGVIIGKKSLIDRMKKNPLTRALRVDKMTLSLLETTLKYYFDEEWANLKIPTLRMITEAKEDVLKRAKTLFEMLDFDKKKILVDIVETKAQIGGGSMPITLLDSYGLSIKTKNVTELEKFLRNREIPLIVRIEKENVIIDLKTIFVEDFENIKSALFDFEML